MELDPRLIRVAKVLPHRQGVSLSNATGFFFLRDGFLDLITCRHVVRDDASGHQPDQLKVIVHADRHDLTQGGELALDLYDDQGRPLWREHPTLGATVDVVAVPVNDPTVIASWYVDSFTPADLGDEHRPLPLGQRVLVVGFPLGFEDNRHRLPMVRIAGIASVYPLPFHGDPYFVTDARLHRGASGAPIIAELDGQWKLLGVHAASLDLTTRDPNLDDKLGLNLAWYASHIEALTRR